MNHAQKALSLVVHVQPQFIFPFFRFLLWSGYVLACSFNDVLLFTLCFLTLVSAESLKCWEINLKYKLYCLIFSLQRYYFFFVNCSNKNLWRKKKLFLLKCSQKTILCFQIWGYLIIAVFPLFWLPCWRMCTVTKRMK